MDTVVGQYLQNFLLINYQILHNVMDKRVNYQFRWGSKVLGDYITIL